MKTHDKNKIGIVVECYDHNTTHRVLVVLEDDVSKSYHFFYVPRVPAVDFGDRIAMNFTENKFYIRRGNSKLTYKITPLVFPKSLLWELISERINL